MNKGNTQEQEAKEQLSAYMDDALMEEDKEALLLALKTNPQLQATWKNFHLIRNVLQQKQDPLLLGYGAMLCARVSAALENEPPVVWCGEFDKPVVMNTTHQSDELNMTTRK